ncbi:MAG: glycosyltransferase [Omnitrophica WOR_2 bacterium]|jgi:glycosyltransferase involved in cell wall biosynthesis
MNVSIFNGAGQADYLYGLVSGLIKTPVDKIDILDIDLSSYLFDNFEKVNFHAVYKYHKKGASFYSKANNILRFYYLQATHILRGKKRIIHFQWLNRYYFTDRFMLPLLARLRGHKVILTVHNVNSNKRDNHDSYYNRITLSLLYNLCNHLIVHTEGSKKELIEDFKINPNKISVIKHGMNNKVTARGINQLEARKELMIEQDLKVILFFGNIDYYKGLDLLVESISLLSEELKREIILLIAGNYKSKDYIQQVNELIQNSPLQSQIIPEIKFIKDENVEKYFMASDCIVLPYRDIYQSGVLFMAYNFGLPTIATKVGNFENDISEAKTGFICPGIDTKSIAETIEKYFNSAIYEDLNTTRVSIREWSYKQFSWDKIGEETHKLYLNQLNN